MSQTADCPYCGSRVALTQTRVGYDEKVRVYCPNCGGQFEHMPGFGSFSIPGEGPRTQQRISTDGAYPGTTYEDGSPWKTESRPPQQSGCGTCCGICICIIILFTILPILFGFGFISWFFWLFS